MQEGLQALKRFPWSPVQRELVKENLQWQVAGKEEPLSIPLSENEAFSVLALVTAIWAF